MVTRAGYDGVGNVVSRTDGLGRVTTSTYDSLDRLASVTDPNNRTTAYGYDRASNLTRVTDAAGGLTTFGYDAANQRRVIDYSDPATPDVSFGYDAKGRRESMTDGTGTSTYGYDSRDRLRSHTSGAGRSMSYGYDLGGRLTTLTYPPVGTTPLPTVGRGYDAAGRLTSVSDWLGRTSTFGYDPNANLVAATYGNATTGTWSYDNADRLVGSTAANGAGNFLDLDYSRDNVGLLTAEGPIAYGYDPADRLTSASASPTASYGYDAGDNPTTLAVAGTSSSQAFDPAHQLTTSTVGGQSFNFSFDAKGNRTARNALGGGTNLSYGWDQANRLASDAGATHRYDGDGLRATTSGSASKTFTWDRAQGLPLMVHDGSSAWITGPGGLPLEQIDAAGSVQFFHQDQLGSTRALTDGAGQVAATYTYDPYGNPATSTGTVANPFGYAGEYRDESGLIYLRARYYDPATAQFVSRDPIETVSGQPYAYAGDSPLNNTDPSRLICIATAQSGRASPAVNPVGTPVATAALVPNTADRLAGRTAEGVNVIPSSGSTFVVTPRGTVYEIPEGWSRRPADNGRGIVYQLPGAIGNANIIRIMEPTARYPSGYIVVHNSAGQPVDVFGRPGSRPTTHVPETYRGPWSGWRR